MVSSQIAIQEDKSNTPSIINDMAVRFGMDKRAFEATIKQTCMPNDVVVSNEAFVAFLLIAKQYNLNPLTKEVFAFKGKRGGVQTIVSIDGWCNIINSNPALDGIEFEDILHEGKLLAIKCRISRKDRAKPIEAVEYMEECKRDTQPWNQWPNRMLRHKALIQCARYAFSLSGIVDQDEAERMVDVTPNIDQMTGMENKNKSIWKNNPLRNAFVDGVQTMLKEAKNADEVEDIMELHEEKLEAMRHGDSRDELAVESIENVRLFVLKRLSPVLDIEAEEISQEEAAELEEHYGLSERP